MARVVYNLYEAKTALSRLVDRAAAGEEIVIAKAGSPRAKLVPARAARKPRKPGGWEGKVRIGKDFDAPLPKTIREALGGGGCGFFSTRTPSCGGGPTTAISAKGPDP